MKRFPFLIFLLCSIVVASAQTAPSTQPASSSPRIVNAGFEEWDTKTGLPVGWSFYSEQKRYPNVVSRVETGSPEGKFAVQIYLPMYDFVALQQYIRVDPKTKYRISCKMRGTFRGRVAVNVEPIAGMVVPIDDTWNFEDATWREHSFELDSGAVNSLGVQFRFVGKGEVCVDDLRIEPVTAGGH